MESFKEEKNCIVERENAFFKSSPVDEYHLPQKNSEKVCFGCSKFFNSVGNLELGL
jgi:hypothetical protein